MLMRVVLRFILGLMTDVFSLLLDVSQVARVQRLQLMDMQGLRILCRWMAVYEGESPAQGV